MIYKFEWSGRKSGAGKKVVLRQFRILISGICSLMFFWSACTECENVYIGTKELSPEVTNWILHQRGDIVQFESLVNGSSLSFQVDTFHSVGFLSARVIGSYQDFQNGEVNCVEYYEMEGIYENLTGNGVQLSINMTVQPLNFTGTETAEVLTYQVGWARDIGSNQRDGGAMGSFNFTKNAFEPPNPQNTNSEILDQKTIRGKVFEDVLFSERNGTAIFATQSFGIIAFIIENEEFVLSTI